MFRLSLRVVPCDTTVHSKCTPHLCPETRDSGREKREVMPWRVESEAGTEVKNEEVVILPFVMISVKEP